MTAALPLVFAPSPDPRMTLVNELTQQLEKANVGYHRMDRYYSGDQPLAFLAPEVAQQVGDRLAPMVINWPETIVDSVNRRLVPEGFQLGLGAEADDELWRIFTANGLDEDAPLAQSDALVHGLAFLSVWGNDDDPTTPLMAFESSHQVAVRYQPGTGDRVVSAALKRWEDDTHSYATLYLPDEVVRFAAPMKSASLNSPGFITGPWEIDQELDNPLGAVPIVPMVNRGRLLNRAGRSELASVAPIADGINKLATDMMVTSEFFQTPRRWASGIQLPVEAGDRERLQAEVTAYWDEATKKKTWLAGPGVQFGQFPEASMDGFVAGINLLTSALAAIGGLPPDDLGLNTTNPASAEARRAAETTLILRAKEKQRPWGGSYGRAMRLAIAARDGIPLKDVPQEYSRMRTVWRDPATPAIAQSMDAAVKGVDAGIYDVESAQELVGMGPVERASFAARRAQRVLDAGAAAPPPAFQAVGLPALVEAGIISRDEARGLIGVQGSAPAPPPTPAA